MKQKHNIKSLNSNYYMHGKHAVLAALSNKKRRIENIFCTQDVFNENRLLITKHNYEIVKIDFFIKILGHNQNHQGLCAKVNTIFSEDINDIDVTKSNSKIAILDQITDPQNIGAIIRSAAAFEIEAILLPQDNAPNENATIAKTASGALEIVKIIKVTNLRTTMEYFKKHGFWIIGLDGKTTETLTPQLLSDKIIIALGSEDKGLRRLTHETCDYIVKIPMSDKVESLNVSNAASIAFHMAYVNSR